MSAPLDLTAAREATRRRQQLGQHVRQVYTLGVRPIFEMIDQIARETGCRQTVERIAEDFAGIDANVLHVAGGDRWPVSPMRIVGGRT
jgi:hypothetical protein